VRARRARPTFIQRPVSLANPSTVESSGAGYNGVEKRSTKMRRIIALAAVLFLLAGVGSAQTKGLKVYVSVDMEGISGVVSPDQTNSESREYAAARKWMAEDANAVVVGLLAAGATQIVVNDSHGGMRNISPDDLRPEAELISGSPKVLSMMAGIDATFDACVFVGYHAEAGTASAVLDHTISSATVYQVKVNGIEMPELGLNAAIAGTFGVPVIMLSGDAAACRQARSLLGDGVVTVAVKEALSRTAARLVPLPEARRSLQDAAREALLKRAQFKPYRLNPPYQFSVAFLTSAQAEPGALLPMVTRPEARVLAYTTQDYLEGFNILRTLIALAAAR
jgi:D-amino peptidase